MKYCDERQEMTYAVAQFETKLRNDLFEKYFQESNEQELLMYETNFNERGNLFCYKRLMWQKFRLNEILDELNSPKEFFQLGWLFPEMKLQMEKDILTGQTEKAYHLHTSIPPKYFEDPKFIIELQKSLKRFWPNFDINNCKEFNKKELKFGYRNGLRILQLKAMLNIKEQRDMLVDIKLNCNTANDIAIINNQIRNKEQKLLKLANVPLFLTTQEKSQKIYEKLELIPNIQTTEIEK